MGKCSRAPQIREIAPSRIDGYNARSRFPESAALVNIYMMEQGIPVINYGLCDWGH